MKFKFDITLTEQDYLDLNMFHQTRSKFGKKQIRGFRLAIALIVIVMALISILGEDGTVLSAIPAVIVCIVFQLLLKRFILSSVKNQIKAMKKTGKMPYPPKSTLEFYDDRFVEITPDHSTEYKYDVIERVSVVDGKTIYLHLNNIAACIVPVAVFTTPAELTAFLEFIKTKCQTLDEYK